MSYTLFAFYWLMFSMCLLCPFLSDTNSILSDAYKSTEIMLILFGIHTANVVQVALAA